MNGRHNGKYKVYNLCSERSYHPKCFGNSVARFGFDDHNPCPYEMIEPFCANVKQWLDADPTRLLN